MWTIRITADFGASRAQSSHFCNQSTATFCPISPKTAHLFSFKTRRGCGSIGTSAGFRVSLCGLTQSSARPTRNAAKTPVLRAWFRAEPGSPEAPDLQMLSPKSSHSGRPGKCSNSRPCSDSARSRLEGVSLRRQEDPIVAGRLDTGHAGSPGSAVLLFVHTEWPAFQWKPLALSGPS